MKFELSVKPGNALTQDGHFYTHAEFFNAVNNSPYGSLLDRGLAYLTYYTGCKTDQEKMFRAAVGTNVMDIVTRVIDVDPNGQYIDIDIVHIFFSNYALFKQLMKRNFNIIPRMMITTNHSTNQAKIVRLIGFDLCPEDCTIHQNSIFLQERD